MSALDRIALSQSFQTNLPNNNTGLITPTRLRQELGNIINSALFPEDSGSRYLDGLLTTSSFNEFTGSRVDTLTVVTGSYAITGSNIFIGDQTITGSLVVSGSSHTIIGNLTSSGNISSSGEVSAVSGAFNTADIDSGTFDQISSLTAANDLDIGDFDFRALTLTADSLTEGNVVLVGTDGILTEDDDITFTGDTLSVTKIANVDTTNITASGDMVIAGNISASNVTGIHSIGGITTFGYSSSLVTIDGIGGHITASGNISSSGDIDLNSFSSNGQQFAQLFSGQMQIGGGAAVPAVFSGTTINLGIAGQNQHITASSNISASGDVIARTGSFEHVVTPGLNVTVIDNVNTTFVTSSGNISSSATVFGHTGSFVRLVTPLLDATTIVNVNTTAITASSNISSSATVFGNTGSFTHVFTPTLEATTITNVNTTAITASGNISSSATIIADKLNLFGLANQGSEVTSLMIDGSNVIGTRELGTNAFTSTTIGTTTEALTVDNVTLELDSGTTFNGSLGRTISIKDGGVDSDALAADISVTSLTATSITASIISSSTSLITNDISIKDFPSVSASLAEAGGATPNLQQITDSGAVTTTAITGSAFSASGDISADGFISNNIEVIRHVNGTTQIGKTGVDTLLLGNISSSEDIVAKGFNTGKTLGNSFDGLHYTVDGRKVEVRNQLQAELVDGAFATLELRNASIAHDSIVLGSFTGNTVGAITGSIITVATIAANTGSVQIHNETGIAIADDTGFTASFIVL